MTRLLRRLAAALLASLALAGPAGAASYSVDFTDMWWNAAEAGWGLNVIQQNEKLFVTFFVYGPDNTARWYVGSSVAAASPQLETAVRFSGALYQTTGPWFGGPFSTAASGVREVGSVTLTFDGVASGTLAYVIDGTVVTKQITRYYFRKDSVAGVYIGGLVSLASQCAASSDNGHFDILGTTTVTQLADEGATDISFKVDFFAPNGQAASCTFLGRYAQQGRLASVTSGTFSCAVNGQAANAGTFAMTALDPQMNGFHAQFSGRDQFCTYQGRFGGTRDAGT
jgi:hypothetical protein